MRLLLFCVATGLSVWLATDITWRTEALSRDHETANADARRMLCEQNRDELLSKGRWIRTYDPKTGFSSYRFATKKEQR